SEKFRERKNQISGRKDLKISVCSPASPPSSSLSVIGDELSLRLKISPHLISLLLRVASQTPRIHRESCQHNLK
ncbi:hypothetical protein AKJ16_DCAP18982, partial [Drosera capensis]